MDLEDRYEPVLHKFQFKVVTIEKGKPIVQTISRKTVMEHDARRQIMDYFLYRGIRVYSITLIRAKKKGG